MLNQTRERQVFITRVRKGTSDNKRRVSLGMMGLAVFSLSLSAFVTSTAAWFNVSRFLEVQNLSVSLVEHSIEIGMRDSDGNIVWGDNVTNDEQAYLDPVSSMFQDNSNYSNTSFPTLSSQYNYESGHEVTSIATSGFVSLECYLRCAVPTFVYLDTQTSVTANSYLNSIKSMQLGVSESELNKVQDALRVAFYSEDGYYVYEPNVSSPSHTKLGGLLDVAFFDGYYDYDRTTKQELLYGEYNSDATLFYDEAVDTDTPHPETNDLGLGFKGSTKAGVKHLDIAKSESLGNLRIKEETTYTLADLGLGNQEICYLEPGIIKRLIVTFYLEGWDKDCVSTLRESAFDAHIAFRGYQMPRD